MREKFYANRKGGFMIEWKKVEDESPPKGGEYLVTYYHPHREESCVTCLRWVNKSRIKFSEKHIKMGWVHKGAAQQCNVTHWAYLPNAAQ